MMTRDDETLLMFLETQIVDHCGLVASDSMNKQDYEIAKKWDKDGLIAFGRRPAADMAGKRGRGSRRAHWVKFSDGAWTIAHRLRRERGERHVATISGSKAGEADSTIE